jgi:hypothetical protein
MLQKTKIIKCDIGKGMTTRQRQDTRPALPNRLLKTILLMTLSQSNGPIASSKKVQQQTNTDIIQIKSVDALAGWRFLIWIGSIPVPGSADLMYQGPIQGQKLI